jgi:hypothetical protein
MVWGWMVHRTPALAAKVGKVAQAGRVVGARADRVLVSRTLVQSQLELAALSRPHQAPHSVELTDLEQQQDRASDPMARWKTSSRFDPMICRARRSEAGSIADD